MILMCYRRAAQNDLSHRYIAAAVPLLQAIRLAIAGFKVSKTKGQPNGDLSQPTESSKSKYSIVTALSRTGSAREAVGGPLLYVLVIVISTLLEWRTSLVGVMAICQMAAGDGMADLVGRRLKGRKWWFSDHKSYAGSAAFVVAAFLTSLGLVGWLHTMGCLAVGAREAALRILAISVACALIESGTYEGVDDNLSVPVTAAVLTRVLFPGM